MKLTEEQKLKDDEMQAVLVERIENLCKEKGLSTYQLALEAGIPMSTLAHIMKGTTKNPGIFTLVRICEGLGISLSEFFDIEAFRILV